LNVKGELGRMWKEAVVDRILPQPLSWGNIQFPVINHGTSRTRSRIADYLTEILRFNVVKVPTCSCNVIQASTMTPV